MPINRSAVVCSAAALIATAVISGHSASASTQSSQTALSSVAASPVVLKTAKRDVDGDKKLDTIVLEDLRDGKHRYRLAITTAKGTKASYTFATPGDVDHGSMWQGTALLDNTPGVEIKLLTAFGDCGHFTVFTWRKNKLIHLGGPDGGWASCADPDLGYSGYIFSQRSGKRAVESAALTPLPGKKAFKGTATTYLWSGSAWKKVSSRKLTLTAKQSYSYPNWSGITFAM